MRSSDAHLEKALEEYNDKVNRLEEGGDSVELLDAYIKRGSILSMMEYSLPAIDDFDDAIEIMDGLENSGHTVDAGYFVKAHITRGELLSVDGGDSMVDDYRIASTRLGELTPDSKFYDENALIEMCYMCADSLIENDRPVESLPFINKGMSLLVGKVDDISRNAFIEFNQLLSQYYMDTDEPQKAYDTVSKTVSAAKSLFEEGKINDRMDLAVAYITKADVDEFLEKDEEYFDDLENAISILEDMKFDGSLDNEELLSNIHGEIAQTYLRKGKPKEAEAHLKKQVSYTLSGSTEYLNGEYDLE